MAAQPTAQTMKAGWMEWAPGQRWDPSTGAAQWFNRGNWQDVGNVKYDPHTGGITLNDKPLDMRANAAAFAPGGSSTVLPNIEQLKSMSLLAAQQQAAQGASGTQGASTGTGIQAAPSYWGSAPQQPGGAQAGSAGAPGATGAPGAQGSVSGAQSGGNATQMATTTATQIPTGVWKDVNSENSPKDIADWQSWYGANVGKTILVNGQPRTIGSDIQPDEMLQAFQQDAVGWGPMPGPAAPTQPIGGPGQAQPESVGLAQMAQIDPVSEALRTGLGASYLTQLAKTSQPTAADFQSLLNTYRQVDPQGYAQRVSLAGGVDKFVQQMQQQAALGSKLDPGTIREVEQGTRQAQIARGNVYGTPQLVAETMARGTAGEQRLLQRQQQLGGALGLQQGYLGAGLGLGDVAMSLYNQRQNQLRASQGAALGYLGSGQTPYQAGASYLNMAEQRAAAAGQGGPQYQPAALGQQYTGAGAPSFPQYGLDMSQLAGNWYNNINQANLQAYGLQQAYGGQGASGGQRAMGAGIGALGGAASGALAGAAAGGIGAIPGAIIGGIGGAASGYFK